MPAATPAAAPAAQAGPGPLDGATERMRRWWGALPLATKGVLSVCTALYLLPLLVGYEGLIISGCLSPFRVAVHLQLWRALTAPFLHVGLLHLVFNMLAYVPMARQVEAAIGSVRFVYLTLVAIVAIAVVHVTVAWAAHAIAVLAQGATAIPKDQLADLAAEAASRGSFYVLRMLGGVHACAVGLSALIFAHVAYEPAFEGSAARSERSVFGLFSVPTRYYPWVLLVLFQLMIPNASMIGHLAGLLVGLGMANGPFMNTAVHLSHATATRVEAKLPSRITNEAPGFVSSPGPGWTMTAPLPTHAPGGGASSSAGAGGWWARMSGGSSTTPAFSGTAHTVGAASSSSGMALPWGRRDAGGTFAALPASDASSAARAAAAAAAAARAQQGNPPPV